jgi:bleomycin resistance family protein
MAGYAIVVQCMMPADRCDRIPLNAGPGSRITRREHLMKSRITLITLGVDDLDRSARFYRDGLGLKTEGITSKEEVNAVGDRLESCVGV